MDQQMQDWLADLGEHGEYMGVFSRYEAKGAWPNGTRVRKVNSEDGDGHPDGSLGTILGSLKCEGDAATAETERLGISHLYFIEWDASPKKAIGTMSIKLEKAGDGS